MNNLNYKLERSNDKISLATFQNLDIQNL